MDHYTDLTIERKRQILAQLPLESTILCVHGGQLKACSLVGRVSLSPFPYLIRFQTSIYPVSIDNIEIPEITYAQYIAGLIVKNEKENATGSIPGYANS